MNSVYTQIVSISLIIVLSFALVIIISISKKKIKELEKEVEELSTKISHLSTKNFVYQRTNKQSIESIERLLELLISLPLVKVFNGYRVTYEVQNRQKARIRIREVVEGKSIRKTIEGKIGYGNKDNWISVEDLRKLLCSLTSSGGSETREILSRCYNTLKG